VPKPSLIAGFRSPVGEAPVGGRLGGAGIPKASLLGIGVSAVTYGEAVAAVLDAARQRCTLCVTALDAHGLSRATKDARFAGVLSSYDVVTPDGHSLRVGLNLLHGTRLPDRVAGPDLTMAVCRAAVGERLPIYLYGSRTQVVEAMVARLKGEIPDLCIAGWQPSRFRPATPEEDEADIRLIGQSGAAILFVGLGCPLQEHWIHDHRDRLQLPMLAVGAAFDFISGNKPRAPRWMQRSGLEWIFRIVSEPNRLVRRSIPAVAHVFVALLWEVLATRLKGASGVGSGSK
jgi:N-acetylglucosaminyldiphosphoundecaprenol N-acetyl-beta-D-mannosaminyltransferase